MRRRDFIGLLGGAAASLPRVARAQPTVRMRRIGVLEGGSATDADAQSDVKAFEERLQKLGWTPDNVVIDYRWATGDAERARALARELLSMTPDVVLAIGIAPVAALREETHTVPILFARVSDPVGQGFVASLARPGGNVTGFSNFEPAMGGKWLQTLKEIAPNTNHVAVMANPQSSALNSYFPSIAAVAGSLSVEPVRASVHNLDEMERAISAESDKPGGGLIVIPDGFMITNRAAVIVQASKYRLPAVYPFRFFAANGGLVSYGVDTKEQFRGAASYVDRILKGEKPGDLPVQEPSKFELLINLKTAKALALKIPESTLSLADEVIE